MAKWIVITQVLVRRTYQVEATDAKDAIGETARVSPFDEDDLGVEETLSVDPV